MGKDTQDMHDRLMNWAQWATSGCIPGVSTVHFVDASAAVDELEAAETEAAMVLMRAERWQEWRLAEMVYLKRWTIPTCCDALAGRRGKRVRRVSRTRYYMKLQAMYGCLRNLLKRT